MASPTTDELPRLGRYQVLNKLAQGGMAEIFLAKALGVMGFERLVAIKLIHSQLTRDSEFVKMFIDEARIAMHLSHRNIVQVFDLDKTGDTYFIAMEYIHGVNLYDVYERIASKGRWLDLPLALYIVAETCKGLHFAHTRIGPDGRPLGIVHRDISPQNVLLSFEGEVKITDFGIAKAAERLHQTTPGIVKGKYAYMAPEILKERGVDGRADVFAAGVLLYELLVGENPYAGATPVATIENVLNKDVPPPSARGAMVSRELDEIALRALAKDPDERYRNAAELAEALTEHGLNLTSLRRDVASGDATVATLLADLFPEKLKRTALGQPGGVKLPIAETAPRVLPTDNQKTDPSQSENLDSTLLNMDRAPAGADMYTSDDEPRTALDLNASMISGDKTEGMQAVRSGEVPTAKAMPSLDAYDTRPPVIVGPSDIGPEDGFEATMMQGARGPSRTLPIPEDLPQVIPVYSDPPPAARSADPLVVPVRNPTALPAGSFQPAPYPPGLLAPPPAPPPMAAPAAGLSRSYLMAGIALVCAALAVIVALVATGSGSPKLVAMPIQTQPQGASVLINGVLQANLTPIEAMLPVGNTHRIELRYRGHKPVVQEIMPIEGTSPAINVALVPILGTLRFDVDPPDATVSINGKPRGSVTTPITDLTADQDFAIKIERAGYKPYTQFAAFTENNLELTIKAKLEKAP